jgi:uncharacterized oligopeptide transporter (OPT) family protein
MRRVWALVTAAVIAAGVAAAGFGAILFGVQISGFSAGSLTLLLRPSLFPLAIGGLVGFRAGLSLLIGSVVAYGVLAPALLREGVIPLTARVSLEVWPTDVELPVRSAHGGGAYSTATGMLTWQGVMPEAERDRLLARSRDAEFATAVELLYDRSRAVLDPARAVEGAPQPSFGVLLQWLVWPGTALMVAAALTKLVLSWRTFLGWTDSHRVRGAGRSRPDRPTSWGIRIALGLVILISMGLQVALFEIPWWAALLATALALMLALVAARVSGETGVTPTGQMAKISQLTFGALLPATPAANLMAANVSAGAASQSADLLDDLKAGHLVGTPPRWQTIAQIVGVLTGAAVCAAVFVVVFGQTPERLLTEEWPAPAVAVVAAVAELFAQGGAVLPPGAALAMGIAAAVGVALTILEELAPGRWKPWMLSGASLGLAFVIPGYLALGIFLGSLIALVVQRVAARWSGEYFIAICAGAIAGDSLFSVGQRVWLMRERIGSVLFGG